MWFEKPIEFWFGILAVIVFKIKTSERLGFASSIFTVVISLASSVAFSGYISVKFGLPLEMAGALVALLADQAMRVIVRLAEDPEVIKKTFLSKIFGVGGTNNDDKK